MRDCHADSRVNRERSRAADRSRTPESYSITVTKSDWKGQAGQIMSGEPVTNQPKPQPVFENNTLIFHQAGMRVTIKGDSADNYVDGYLAFITMTLGMWIPDWIVQKSKISVPYPSGEWNGTLSELLGILYLAESKAIKEWQVQHYEKLNDALTSATQELKADPERFRVGPDGLTQEQRDAKQAK